MKFLQVLGTTRGAYDPGTMVTIQIIDDQNPAIIGPFRYIVEGDVNPSEYGLFLTAEAALKADGVISHSENCLHDGLMHSEGKAEIMAILDKTEIINDGVDKAMILGLPNPVMVRINHNPPEIITGGTLELSSTETGEFIVQIVDEMNYLPKEWKIDVIAAQ